ARDHLAHLARVDADATEGVEIVTVGFRLVETARGSHARAFDQSLLAPRNRRPLDASDLLLRGNIVLVRVAVCDDLHARVILHGYGVALRVAPDVEVDAALERDMGRDPIRSRGPQKCLEGATKAHFRRNVLRAARVLLIRGAWRAQEHLALFAHGEGESVGITA